MKREVKRLHEFLWDGLTRDSGAKGDQKIGMEIETPFLSADGDPISVETSQQIFRDFIDRPFGMNWRVTQQKGNMLTEITNDERSKLLYELGRHNLELSVMPETEHTIASTARSFLHRLYEAADRAGASPHLAPVLETDEDLLMIPDERDATWENLDGRPALRTLARTASVQYTFDVLEKRAAIEALNRLGKRVDCFLADYPQDAVWKRYIAESKAHYRADRYGGPLIFLDSEHYCEQLVLHDVVRPPGELVPHAYLEDIDIPTFVRSVWWHFRLRRFKSPYRLTHPRLCIEVRPFARRGDDLFESQLKSILDIVNF